MMKFLADKAGMAFVLLALLMTSHLAFLGFGAMHCRELNLRALEKGHTGHLWEGASIDPKDAKRTMAEGCSNYAETFQNAAASYVAVILALMAPLPRK